MRLAFLIFLCAFCVQVNGADKDRIAQECLKKYYPQIKSIEDNQVILHDGSVFVWNDGIEKTYEQKVLDPDMHNAFEVPYPFHGSIIERDKDTSRIRHLGFYKSIYGDTEDDVASNLVKIPWLSEWIEQSYIYVTARNGVGEAFKRVIEKLENLPPTYFQFLKDQDAFYWRNIADSPNLSPHSLGIALDINVQYSQYWLWDIKERNQYRYENQIPLEIVRIFEEEGFVWGGRWWHYDTMHFEYRPEIICFAKNYNLR